MKLSDIEKILKKKSSEKTKASWHKFVASTEKIYGVKVPVLNEIARKIKEPNFELIEKLWQSNAFEKKLLASKILARICKKDPDKALKLIERFSKDISDWAVCDTLATQGIRKIAKIRQKEIFGLSQKYVVSKNPWQRRFGLVLLINFAKDKSWQKQIKEILKKAENDKEYYVKKAIVWLKSKIK